MNFTKYAEQKFEILNKHKVFYTKEMIEEAINMPDKVIKKNKFFFAQKDGIKVVYKNERSIFKIITFYPAKN